MPQLVTVSPGNPAQLSTALNKQLISQCFNHYSTVFTITCLSFDLKHTLSGSIQSVSVSLTLLNPLMQPQSGNKLSYSHAGRCLD